MLITSKSIDDTLKLGKTLGELLIPGDIIALIGEMGVGKTWLSRGIAYGMGVSEKEYVHSPAYDIIHEYSGKTMIYHMDFYRMGSLSQDDYFWLEEYMNMDGVCIIEWADKYINDFVLKYLQIKIDYENDINSRKIEITGLGKRYLKIKEALTNDYPRC